MTLPFTSKRSRNETSLQEMGGIAGAVQGWLQSRGNNDRHLRLIETMPLGARRSVALLECDGMRYLLGISASGVQTIVPVAGSTEPRNAVEHRKESAR